MSINSSSDGPRRIRKRERPPVRSNSQSNLPCFSPNKPVEGTGRGWAGARRAGAGGGGGSQHGSKISRDPLHDSPYAERVFFTNNGSDYRTLPMDPINPGHQRSSQTPPLPVLSITTRAPGKRQANRTSNEADQFSRSGDGDGGERGRFFGGSTSPSFDGGDSPRSINSAKSFETLASTGDLFDDYDGTTTTTTVSPASTASVAAEKDGNGRTKRGLGVVDRTLFESWKELPWQARLCPRAIEDQEVVRRTAALEAEVSNASLLCLASRLDAFRVWGRYYSIFMPRSFASLV